MDKRRVEVDWDSDKYKEARLKYLSQFLFGESMSANYCEAMSEFAPSVEARNFLLLQKKDEDRHSELLTQAVKETAGRPTLVVPHLKILHVLMEQKLKDKNWAQVLFIQNFIVEGIILTLFREQRKHGDEIIVRLFDLIIRDEERHVEFGINEMKKILNSSAAGDILPKLVVLQRQMLYHAVMIFKDLRGQAGDLGMGWGHLARTVVADHLGRVKLAGMPIPLFDRLFLWTVTKVLV